MALDEFQRLVRRFQSIVDRYTVTANFDEKRKLTVLARKLSRRAKEVLRKDQKKIKKVRSG
jgi:hypothetical protein